MDHAGHDHSHDHHLGGGHAHHGTDEYIEQLLTIGICGAFGVVAVLIGYEAVSGGTGMLKLVLAPPFWPWVLAGGVALLVLSLIRAIALWKASGDDHHHDHGDCGHDHESCEEHTHGNVFWRVIILMFPLVLYFLNLPNTGYSKEHIARMLGTDIELSADSLKDVEAKGELALTFEDIANALRDPQLMETMTGLRATVKGQLMKQNDRQFTLYTTKQTCCAADMVPLKAKIMVKSDEHGGSLSSKSLEDHQWLEVKGVLQFVKTPNREQFLPVISARLRDINPIAPE